jgi:hypothetical protein
MNLDGTALTTLATAALGLARGYYAFGSDRRVVGTPATDHRFTGQKAKSHH